MAFYTNAPVAQMINNNRSLSCDISSINNCMNIFIEYTMLSLVVQQTVPYKYDGSTNSLGNVFIDYKKSEVLTKAILKKRTKPKMKRITA